MRCGNVENIQLNYLDNSLLTVNNSLSTVLIIQNILLISVLHYFSTITPRKTIS